MKDTRSMTSPSTCVVTAEFLRSKYLYEPDAGLFYLRGPRVDRREPIGSTNHKGYLVIKIARREYRAHRLAWLYVYGKWPDHEIDHINGIRSDNRIKNLRDVTTLQNAWNRRHAKRTNSTQMLGVSRQRNGKFGSAITSHGITHWLGTFDSPDAAHAAYMVAKARIHEESAL